MLKTFSVSTCEDFKEKYFSREAEPARFLARASAYDFGVCMPQDFEKAAFFYEEALARHQNSIMSQMRLALIYSYGPKTLRKPDRASFLFKQTAIDTVPYDSLDDLSIKEAVISAPLYKGVMPQPFTRELQWVKHLMKQEKYVRKNAATELSRQGFEGTNYLWDRLDLAE